METLKYNLKILVIGNKNSGKSSFITQYTERNFYDLEDKDSETIDFKVRSLQYQEAIYKIQIFEMPTNISDSLRTVPYSLRNIDVIIYLYDITSQHSFDMTSLYLDKFQNQTDAISVLVGHKVDMSDHRIISQRIGKEKADKYSIAYAETSCKLSSTIDELIIKLIDKVNEIKRPAVSTITLSTKKKNKCF